MAIHALPCAGGRQHVAVNSRPRSLAPALAPRPQAQPLPPHRCRRLQTVPQEQPLPSHRCRRLQVYARRSSGRGGSGGPRRQEPVPIDRLVQQYALPALGLLVVGSLVAPVLGGLIFAATGVGIMIAAGAAALSLSWVVVPLAVAVFGMPALMAGGLAAGVFATAAAGALLLPLIQLVLVGGGLWLGASLAQQLFYRGGSEAEDGTIDVEARTIDDDWRDEMFKEKKEREAELREFDDLLRRRDEFKRGRGPPYS